MSGLAGGINANSGVALAAAQSVASQITATMKKAMDIHSPSRVMRDDVGRFIPEGLALGIDKYADKAYEAMQSLSSGLMNPIVPEIASGAYNIGAATNVNYINYGDNSSTTKLDQLVVIMSQFSKDLKNLKLEANGKNLAEVVENERNFRASMIAKARG